jgi:hypothetical protein
VTHARVLFAAAIGLLAVQCGGTSEDEPTEVSRAAILGGAEVDASYSSVLYLSGPQGTCTSVLIAPTLVLTARHCVAQLNEGAYSCDASGNLVSNGSAAGEIGADDPPGELQFFSSGHVVPGAPLGPPEAYGLQIISTETPSVCRDDLALVVITQSIPGIAPAPIRIDGPTQPGEPVSVWGYGLTDQLSLPTLRVRSDGQVVGIGPALPTEVPQSAPLRSVRIGPDAITCNGDSGGPITATSTGAVVATVSIGSQASTVVPYCVDSADANTTGPQLSNYRALILSAFQVVGSSPILEEDLGADASVDSSTLEHESGPATDGSGGGDGSDSSNDGAGHDATDARPSRALVLAVSGGSCSIGLDRQDRAGPPWAVMGLALAATAAARSRRGRRPSGRRGL